MGAGLLVAALLSSCSGVPTVGDGGSAKGATTPGTSGSGNGGKVASDEFTRPIYSDPDLESLWWSGGAVLSGRSSGDREGKVVGWMPGMEGFKTCDLTLRGSDEFAPTDILDAPSIDVMATTASSPRTLVLYSTTTRASGLEGEKTSIRVRDLDLESCTLGEPIVLVDDVPEEMGSASPEFMGTSDEVLAIGPFSTITTELPDIPVLLGYNPATRTVVWQKRIPGKGFTLSMRTPASFDFSAYVADDHSTPRSRGLYAPATGERMLEAHDFESPTVDLGGGRVLTTMRKKETDFQQVVIEGGRVSDIRATMSEETFRADDGRGGTVLVGYYCQDGDDDCYAEGDGRALGYLASDNRVHEILPAGKVDELKLRLLGASNGVVYVRTTSEHLTIGLDGQQLGEPRVQDYDFLPLSERRVDGVLWTLWRGAGKSGFAITKDGRHLPSAQEAQGSPDQGNVSDESATPHGEGETP